MFVCRRNSRSAALAAGAIALGALVSCSQPDAAGSINPFLTMSEETALELGVGMIPEEQARWGYLDRRRRTIIEPTFHFARPFHEGLGAVQFLERVTDGEMVAFRSTWGAVSREGELVVEPICTYLGDYADGVAKCLFTDPLQAQIGSTGGYIDATGSLVIPWQFPGDLYFFAGPFSEGLAVVPLTVSSYDPEDGHGARSTESTVDALFDPATPRGVLLGYIDRKGDLVIHGRFIIAGAFREGRAVAVPEGTHRLY